MKKMLLLGAAFATFALNAPAQAELKFKPGEDKRFNWANYEELKKVDLKGETLSIFGPWRGEDEGLVRGVLDYFSEATGVEIKYSSSENYEQQIVMTRRPAARRTSPCCRSRASSRTWRRRAF